MHVLLSQFYISICWSKEYYFVHFLKNIIVHFFIWLLATWNMKRAKLICCVNIHLEAFTWPCCKLPTLLQCPSQLTQIWSSIEIVLVYKWILILIYWFSFCKLAIFSFEIPIFFEPVSINYKCCTLYSFICIMFPTAPKWNCYVYIWNACCMWVQHGWLK